MKFYISHRGHLYVVTTEEELLAFHVWFQQQQVAA